MGTPSPAPIIIQQPVGVTSWPAAAMQRQDPFKYAAAPIVEKPVPEQAVSKPSTDAPSSSGVRQLVRSFEDRKTAYEELVLDDPHMFEPRVIDEVAERLGIELKAGMKKKGMEEKALYIREKLAEMREKGKAPM
jgi:hypothetical protein